MSHLICNKHNEKMICICFDKCCQEKGLLCHQCQFESHRKHEYVPLNVFMNLMKLNQCQFEKRFIETKDKCSFENKKIISCLKEYKERFIKEIDKQIKLFAFKEREYDQTVSNLVDQTNALIQGITNGFNNVDAEFVRMAITQILEQVEINESINSKDLNVQTQKFEQAQEISVFQLQNLVACNNEVQQRFLKSFEYLQTTVTDLKQYCKNQDLTLSMKIIKYAEYLNQITSQITSDKSIVYNKSQIADQKEIVVKESLKICPNSPVDISYVESLIQKYNQMTLSQLAVDQENISENSTKASQKLRISQLDHLIKNNKIKIQLNK